MAGRRYDRRSRLGTAVAKKKGADVDSKADGKKRFEVKKVGEHP